MVDNFRRVGSVSNAHVGRDFESEAQRYFRNKGIALYRNHRVNVGVPGKHKKAKQFDLGSDNPPILVECKSHKWTAGGNVPSAKLTVWNEAMYYFALAPKHYRKILFVLSDFNERRQETLAGYYRRIYGHLIPDGVKIMEFSPTADRAPRRRAGLAD